MHFGVMMKAPSQYHTLDHSLEPVRSFFFADYVPGAAPKYRRRDSDELLDGLGHAHPQQSEHDSHKSYEQVRIVVGSIYKARTRRIQRHRSNQNNPQGRFPLQKCPDQSPFDPYTPLGSEVGSMFQARRYLRVQ
jgi:hypothetical protein